MTNKIVAIHNRNHPGTAAYNWFFYSHAIKGVLRKNRIIYKHPRYGRDDKFSFHPKCKQKWYELFEVPEDVTVPFTYYDFSRAVGLMIVIDTLGVNFKDLLHLKCELKFYKYLVPGEDYVIDYVFETVVRIKKDKAAIVGHTAIRRNGELYLEMRDHFVVKEAPLKDIARLKPDETNEFKGITRLPADPLLDCKTKEIYIPAHLAKQYGATSGDKNIVHTSPFVARLFGYDRPFIQGLCTANLIMKELCIAGIELKQFSITFGRPVFLRSTVVLCYTDSEYRLQDEAGNILCFGKINQEPK